MLAPRTPPAPPSPPPLALHGTAPEAHFVAVKEAARLLNISTDSLYEWCRRRKNGQPEVAHVRLGRRVLICRTWLERVLRGEVQP